jgi:hydroxymethylpyrimidine/phosphomethylpyrimidine kinase
MHLNSIKKLPITLSIAGFDPTAGAGLLSDIKTFAAFNCYGLAVTSAITVQDSAKVYDSMSLPTQLVVAQLEALFNDFQIAAVKIGMLANEEIASAVAELLCQFQPEFIVLDPLILSSSGFPLATPATKKIICEKLFPIANIITPNLFEAAELSQQPVCDILTMKQAAAKLSLMGAKGVLIKGGHLIDSAIDLFYDGKDYHLFPATRLSHGAHGTGCVLSAAVAALLAQGKDSLTAIAQAKQYLTEILSLAQILGKSEYLLDHFAGLRS